MSLRRQLCRCTVELKTVVCSLPQNRSVDDGHSHSIYLSNSLVVSTEHSICVRRVWCSTWAVYSRAAETPRLGDIKAQIGGLKAEATIATFLAAVQSQIVALSYENNSTRIEIATNVLGFAGVLLGVVTACLALLASTILQRHIHIIESQLTIIDELHLESIEGVIRQIMALGPLSRFVYLGVFRRAILKCEARLAEAQPRHNIETHGTHEEMDIDLMMESCEHIQSVTYIGDAAGTAMLLGIVLFLASVMCLAVATQPPVVWIISAVTCSSILVLPMGNRVLGALFGMRFPSVFDF